MLILSFEVIVHTLFIALFFPFLGECKKNADYMNIYCARSCGKCKAKGSGCNDENKNCKAWADKDYCKKGSHVNYMNLRCKKSCGKC